MKQVKEEKILSLTNDAVMKLFFANEENEQQLRQFLKATTPLTDADLTTIHIKNPKLTKQHVEEKDFYVDIHLTTAKGEKINIEMQARNHDGFKERMVAYNARQYGSQLKIGENYPKLKSAISLIITNFEMFDDTTDYYEHIIFRRKNTKPFTNAQQFCILDLTKLPENLTESKIQWGRLFRAKTKKELKMLMENSKEMREAGAKLLKLSANEEARAIAEAREYARWTYEHTLQATEERSRKEGLKEGLKEGRETKAIEIAKELILQGFSKDVVSKVTGLSVEDLDKF